MATTRARSHKHFQLDAAKLRRAQKVLRARTETEAIEQALDVVIEEDERNRLTIKANDRFVKSGIKIKDVYGIVEKSCSLFSLTLRFTLLLCEADSRRRCR